MERETRPDGAIFDQASEGLFKRGFGKGGQAQHELFGLVVLLGSNEAAGEL
ncbi:MAG: hypothetical protein R3F19_18105 [Verrucomicrobiales bacterium]